MDTITTRAIQMTKIKINTTVYNNAHNHDTGHTNDKDKDYSVLECTQSRPGPYKL